MNIIIFLSFYMYILISIISTQKNEACPNNDFTFIAKQNGKIPSEFAVGYISYGIPGHYSITIASDSTGGSIAQLKGLKDKNILKNKDAPYGQCTDKYFGNGRPKSVSAVSTSNTEKKQEEIKVPKSGGGCCIRAVNTKIQSSAHAEYPLLPPRLESTVPDLTNRNSWNLGMFLY